MPSPTRRPNLGPATPPESDADRASRRAGGCVFAVAVLVVIGLLGGVAWWIVRGVLVSQGLR
jgi:hypothetical protein